MRWKLLLAFGTGFTVIFVIIGLWVTQFSTDQATKRVTKTLEELSVGGASTIIPAEFVDLTTNVPKAVTPGRTYPTNAGTLAGTVSTAESRYPTDERYWAHVNDLARIRKTNPNAVEYTYLKAPNGTFEVVGSVGAVGYPEMFVDPPAGPTFLAPIAADASASSALAAGLTETAHQSTDAGGSGPHISAYSPIVDSSGTVVGALGVDYPIATIDQARHDVIRVIYPILAIAYLILLAMIFGLSSWLTRRLTQLAHAAELVAEGDYTVDLAASTTAHFNDELTALANAFGVMTTKVEKREKNLTQQVKVLKVEIDQVRRQEAVAEITDSDFFTDLTTKAQTMRAQDEAETIAADVAGSPDRSDLPAGTND